MQTKQCSVTDRINIALVSLRHSNSDT